MPRVTIQALRRRGLGAARIYTAAAFDQTDDRGYFRIFGIPPGTYIVAAVSRLVFQTGRSAVLTYPPTYFPGVLEPDQATRVTIAPGSHFQKYNLTLSETSATTLTGRVIAEDGRPATGATVVGVRLPAASYSETVHADAQGRFSIHGAIPGTYTLTARWPAQNGEPQTARTDVVVGSTPVPEISLILARGTEVRGRVQVERATRIDPAQIEVFVATDDFSEMRTGRASARVESDYTFTLRGVPRGRGRIVTRLPGSAFVEAIYSQGRNIADQEIDFGSGQRLDGLEIVLGSGGGEVSGVVRDHVERVVGNVTVVLFSNDSARQVPYSRFTRVTVTDEQGRYTFQGVIPGGYAICALRDHEFGSEGDPYYLTALGRLARPLKVEPARAITETLVVIPSSANAR